MDSTLGVMEGLFVGLSVFVGLEIGDNVGSLVLRNSERRVSAAKQLLMVSRLSGDSKMNALPAQAHVTGLT